jgi:hypothetical protein
MFTREETPGGEEVLQLRCNPFLGVLKKHGQKYDFAVRFASRKQLLIWGSDFDFDTAVREVSRILLGLQNRLRESEQPSV